MTLLRELSSKCNLRLRRLRLNRSRGNYPSMKYSISTSTSAFTLGYISRYRVPTSCGRFSLPSVNWHASSASRGSRPLFLGPCGRLSRRSGGIRSVPRIRNKGRRGVGIAFHGPMVPGDDGIKLSARTIAGAANNAPRPNRKLRRRPPWQIWFRTRLHASTLLWIISCNIHHDVPHASLSIFAEDCRRS